MEKLSPKNEDYDKFFDDLNVAMWENPIGATPEEKAEIDRQVQEGVEVLRNTITVPEYREKSITSLYHYASSFNAKFSNEEAMQNLGKAACSVLLENKKVVLDQAIRYRNTAAIGALDALATHGTISEKEELWAFFLKEKETVFPFFLRAIKAFGDDTGGKHPDAESVVSLLQSATDPAFQSEQYVREVVAIAEGALKSEDASTRHGAFLTFILSKDTRKNQVFDAIASKYTEEIVSNSGLSEAELLPIWNQSGAEKEHDVCRLKNIFALGELDRLKPGISKTLFQEFGIADFARYPTELLIDQYERKEDHRLPYGLVMWPRSDHNGSFYHRRGTLKELQETLGSEHHLRVVECEGKVDIARTLLTLNKRYGDKEGGHKISFVILGAHGNKNKMYFGEDDERHVIKSDDLKGSGVGRTGSFFEEGATVVLVSCSTGKEGGIGEQLSKALNLTVIAPDDISTVQQLKWVGDSGPVPLEVVYSDGAKAKVYKNS